MAGMEETSRDFLQSWREEAAVLLDDASRCTDAIEAVEKQEAVVRCMSVIYIKTLDPDDKEAMVLAEQKLYEAHCRRVNAPGLTPEQRAESQDFLKSKRKSAKRKTSSRASRLDYRNARSQPPTSALPSISEAH
mmetsp:Transcript_8106/g.25019  ORF Transcript_8106/g.25019 Transcript_8106/m.25019 type:complete len:134 (+) Transcript_8106:34-435(+)|eukprot:CAMPEP_0198656770 /NCGR_PEP_ID=MMETSP1467-20131203/10936_1 /TAXON_ID=1462469 /ORGANISM="unid. sp., Strain CCMP2135" /LENGTH=133 /DNA_ID=CAMNT_0044392845 /DNA_START=31 /DNA_END=432 /DNA_ORIENTATION=+